MSAPRSVVPAVYAPCPHSDQEQKRNALPVVESGGGILVDNADLTRSGSNSTSSRDGDEALLRFVLDAVATGR